MLVYPSALDLSTQAPAVPGRPADRASGGVRDAVASAVRGPPGAAGAGAPASGAYLRAARGRVRGGRAPDRPTRPPSWLTFVG